MITHLAEQNGGTIAGVSFDTVAANAVLTSTAPTGIGICRQLLQRMEDDWIQQQVAVADPAFAIYRALGRLVNTPAGNALKPAYEQMQAIVKNRPPKTNRRRQPKAAATGASTTKPASPVTSNGVATTPAAATVAGAHALPTNGIATNSAS